MRISRWASGGSTKKVSCISRAGWSGLKFSASKLNHSDSTSGPSAISQPMPTKMSATRSCRVDSGWRAPARRRRGAAVTSTVSSTRMRASFSASSSAVRSASALLTRPREDAHELAGGGLLVLRQPADFTVGEAQRGLLTGVREAHGLEFVERGGGGNGGNGLVYGGGDGGFIQGIRDAGARQSFSHLLFLATSRFMPTAQDLQGAGTSALTKDRARQNRSGGHSPSV